MATDWWPPRVGGVESQVFDLARALAARRHDVRIMTTTRGAVDAGDPRVGVEHVAVPMAGEVAVPDLRRIPELSERLQAHAPDVVHAHGMFSTLALGAVLAAHRASMPSVLTVHSLLRPWPVFAGASAIFRAFANRATLLTAVSQAVADDVRRASGRQAVRIPNGIALAEWSAPPHVSSSVRIVAVTRLVPKKRPIDLVHALAALKQRLPDVSITLEVAGDGPERANMERRSVRAGVNRWLVLHGDCSRDRVRALLARASVFAHTGGREAFGISILEALAAGLPIVAMASGGVTELVEHGRQGLLAQDRAGFCRALVEMVGNPGLRQRCALQASRALDVYDWSRVVSQHEAAYEEAIATHYTRGRHVKNRIAATI